MIEFAAENGCDVKCCVVSLLSLCPLCSFPVNSVVLRPLSVHSPTYIFVFIDQNMQVWLPEICQMCCVKGKRMLVIFFFFSTFQDKTVKLNIIGLSCKREQVFGSSHCTKDGGTDIYRETVANQKNVTTTAYCLINATTSKIMQYTYLNVKLWD